MILKYYYWYFKAMIPPRICNDIVRYGKPMVAEKKLGIVGGIRDVGKRDVIKDPLTKKELKWLKKKRDSYVAFMNPRWIYKEIQPLLHIANRNAGWNFEWSWSEDCQFTKYTKGQYYGWHADGFHEPFQKEGPLKGKIRKLSMCVSLSKPEDYKGGELELDLSTPDKKNIEVAPMKEQGSVVVFPSHVQHRVKPVTQGTRYSLVAWFCGNAFV
tara:strand:+ start:2463 stop:3101 length:639 start_codon:yes stop_codon:yes gene_type:complete